MKCSSVHVLQISSSAILWKEAVDKFVCSTFLTPEPFSCREQFKGFVERVGGIPDDVQTSQSRYNM